MRKLLVALRALLYMSGFVLLWGWLALSVRRYDRSLRLTLPAWTTAPGVTLIVLGGILALTCVGTFVARGRGTPAPFDAPRDFVVAGPYKYVRNPMYIGGLTALIGFALIQRSLSMLLFSTIWLLIAHLFVLYYEERALRGKFGRQYEGYCKSVPRWIPRW